MEWGQKSKPQKSLDQNLASKKSHAKFPSHKNFQKALKFNAFWKFLMIYLVAIRTEPVHRLVFAIHTGFLLN